MRRTRFYGSLFVLASAMLCALPGIAKVNIGGRIEVDAAHYREDVTPLQSGTALRRLRVDVSGKLSQKWSFYAQTDLKHGRNQVQLAWVKYRINRRDSLQLGKVEMPFSLESISNSKLNLFMERALPLALTERFGLGGVYNHLGRNWNFRLGVFGDDHFNLGGRENYGHSVAARPD